MPGGTPWVSSGAGLATAMQWLSSNSTTSGSIMTPAHPSLLPRPAAAAADPAGDVHHRAHPAGHLLQGAHPAGDVLPGAAAAAGVPAAGADADRHVLPGRGEAAEVRRDDPHPGRDVLPRDPGEGVRW